MIKRNLVATLVLASALTVAPVASTQAAPDATFTLFGSGFGHGLGMSQWGAFGLANQGWDHQRILTHYYSGTQVGQGPDLDKVRVGLVDGVGSVHLAAKQASVTLHVESPDGQVVATIPNGSTYLVKGASGSYKVVDGNGDPLASVDGSKKLFATYQDAGALLRSAEAGHTYNRGWVELNDYTPCDGCQARLRMIAIVTPQAYLYGLGEVPSSWPAEAMQAQAVAARSYAEYVINALGQNRAGCNCALYDDTRNQVYAGWDHEGENGGQDWVKAVDATAGQVVLYQGRVIDALYMSSSGGYTENNEYVWGGTPVPYLRGVCDPGDYTSSNHAAVWKVSLSASDVTSKLRPYTGDIGTVKGFAGVTRGVSGRVRSVKVVGTSGSKSVAGSTVRGALGLLDDRLWFNNDKNVTGAIRARYDATGCAPGLPRSAETSISGGSLQRFAHGTIYRNTGASKTVWLFGPIGAKYLRLGEDSSRLGLPVGKIASITAAADCDARQCAKARFAHGAIFFKDDTGAHELHGAVFDYFVAKGGAAGHLGFPTSDVTRSSSGARAVFQGAPGADPITVTCSKDGTCSES